MTEKDLGKQNKQKHLFVAFIPGLVALAPPLKYSPAVPPFPEESKTTIITHC